MADPFEKFVEDLRAIVAAEYQRGWDAAVDKVMQTVRRAEPLANETVTLPAPPPGAREQRITITPGVSRGPDLRPIRLPADAPGVTAPAASIAARELSQRGVEARTANRTAADGTLRLTPKMEKLWRALVKIMDRGDFPMTSTITSETDLPKGSLGFLFNSLENRGLIRRTDNEITILKRPGDMLNTPAAKAAPATAAQIIEREEEPENEPPEIADDSGDEVSKNWTAAEIAIFRVDWRTAVPLQQIANKFYTSPQEVLLLADRLSLPVRA